MLRIYDTLTGKKEPFRPISPPDVSLYVCGPTVYGPAHVGHAKTAVVFDMVRRYLEHKGYRVRYVQNFTDVDDKIISRAQETGESWDTISMRYSDEYLREMEELNVEPATDYPRASESIGGITEDITSLIRRGKAYELDGDVYFRVTADPDYGKLSGRKLDEMRAGARVDVNERKGHPMDFALWKSAKPGEPSWPSPWGRGRPGWHIECSTMILYHLGEQIDIHGGGADLIFPHHENEIAQSEQLTGKVPFVKTWMHSGLVQWGGEKMSRSVGNVFSVTGMLERYGGDAFRWFVLSSNYRRPVSYTEESMAFAQRTVQRVSAAANLVSVEGFDATAHPTYPESRQTFEDAMDDDFNTPQALAVLVELARESNKLHDAGKDATPVVYTLRELAGVLGFRLAPETMATNQDFAPFVDLLIEVRSELRAAKQWALADSIRDRLAMLDITLEDKPEGTVWRVQTDHEG